MTSQAAAVKRHPQRAGRQAAATLARPRATLARPRAQPGERAVHPPAAGSMGQPPEPEPGL